MVSINVNLDPKLKKELERFPWVNWSEVGREEILKKDIFETFIKTGKISNDDWKFCEKIDWHPVDELPIKKEYLKKLDKIEKGKHHKMSLKELDELMELE